MLTIPLATVTQVMTTFRAYSTEGGNMDCYAAAESVGGAMAMRWVFFIFFIVYQIYKNRKHELNDLLLRERAEK